MNSYNRALSLTLTLTHSGEFAVSRTLARSRAGLICPRRARGGAAALPRCARVHGRLREFEEVRTSADALRIALQTPLLTAKAGGRGGQQATERTERASATAA